MKTPGFGTDLGLLVVVVVVLQAILKTDRGRGQNEFCVGNEGSKIAFLWPAYYGVSDPKFPVFLGLRTIGFIVDGFRKVRGRKR